MEGDGMEVEDGRPDGGAREWTLLAALKDAGTRLDVFLGDQCKDLSRSHFKRLIQDGSILLNGRVVKPGYELRSGDVVSVRLPEEEAAGRLEPLEMPLDILYEDEHILVVNKGPGVVVHPGAGKEEGTLVHGLLAHCPRLAVQGAPLRPGIVHRLDKDTSGAMVVAKSERAYLHLIEQFKEHRVRKEYRALVYGRMAEASGSVKTFMDRHPEDRKRMAVVQGRGREAITRWEVEEDWVEVSLLRVFIETGRTHQIRVHMSHLQHPLVGDSTYGGGKRRARALNRKELQDLMLGVERQMLHAFRLAFRHPVTGEPVEFMAPFPGDFQLLLEKLACKM